MKISQEVRDFASKQNSNQYVASQLNPEIGMQQMSEKFKEIGEIYIPKA